MKHILSLAIVAALSCAAFAALDSPAGHPVSTAFHKPDKPTVIKAREFRYESVLVMRPIDSEPGYAPTVCPAAIDVRRWNVPVLAMRERPFIPLAKATARSTL